MLFEALMGYFIYSKVKDEFGINPKAKEIERRGMIQYNREQQRQRAKSITDASIALGTSFIGGFTGTPESRKAMERLFCTINGSVYLGLSDAEKIKMAKDFIARTGLTLGGMLLYVSNTFGFYMPNARRYNLYKYNDKIYLELYRRPEHLMRHDIDTRKIFGKDVIIVEICPEFIIQRSLHNDTKAIDECRSNNYSKYTAEEMWEIKKRYYEEWCQKVFREHTKEIDKYTLRDALIVNYVSTDGRTYNQWLGSINEDTLCEKYCGTPDWRDISEHREVMKIWEG